MSSKRIIALIALIIAMVLVVMKIQNLRTTHQYIISAPNVTVENAENQPTDEEQENKNTAKKDSELATSLKKLEEVIKENAVSVKGFFVEGLISRVSLSDDKDKQASSALVGLYGKQSFSEPKVLQFGRLFYQDELVSKSKLALIDEQLAVELFRQGDPIGRIINVGAAKYEVIGILKHERQAGDISKHYLYVPLLSLEDAGLRPEILSANMVLVEGSGGAVTAKKIYEGWNNEGTFISLSKERERSLLPLRYLLVAIAIALVSLMFKAYGIFVKASYSKEKEKLEKTYAKNMIFRWFLIVLVYTLALLFIIFLLYLIVVEALKPVYIFPEWVPSIIVEISSIVETFYNNRIDINKLVEFRSEQLINLQFYRNILGILSLSTLFTLVRPYEIIRSKLLKLKNNV